MRLWLKCIALLMSIFYVSTTDTNPFHYRLWVRLQLSIPIAAYSAYYYLRLKTKSYSRFTACDRHTDAIDHNFFLRYSPK